MMVYWTMLSLLLFSFVSLWLFFYSALFSLFVFSGPSPSSFLSLFMFVCFSLYWIFFRSSSLFFFLPLSPLSWPFSGFYSQRMPCDRLQIMRRPCMDFNVGETVSDSSWTFSRRGAVFLSPGLATWRRRTVSFRNGAVFGFRMAIFDLVIHILNFCNQAPA